MCGFMPSAALLEAQERLYERLDAEEAARHAAKRPKPRRKAVAGVNGKGTGGTRASAV